MARNQVKFMMSKQKSNPFLSHFLSELQIYIFFLQKNNKVISERVQFQRNVLHFPFKVNDNHRQKQYKYAGTVLRWYYKVNVECDKICLVSYGEICSSAEWILPKDDIFIEICIHFWRIHPSIHPFPKWLTYILTLVDTSHSKNSNKNQKYKTRNMKSKSSVNVAKSINIVCSGGSQQRICIKCNCATRL